MNIAVDYGNTAAKVGIFDGDDLQQRLQFKEPDQLREFLGTVRSENIIVSSVSHPAEEVLSWSNTTGQKISLTFKLPLPIAILYSTPHTLGVDRIAAASGAAAIYPNQDCLVVDAGTCITYEFVDHQGNYLGGAISPGISMRFEAMHHFTSRLPLIPPVRHPLLIGTSTESSMQSGVINGVLAEVDGIIEQYATTYPHLKVVVCGGDSVYFENQLKQPIFVSPDLVLIGLNRILDYQTHH